MPYSQKYVAVNNKLNTENAAVETQRRVLIYCCAIPTYVVANVTHASSSHKVPDIFVHFQQNLDFLDIFSKKLPIPNFTDIRQRQSLPYMRTDGQDETKGCFSRLCECA